MRKHTSLTIAGTSLLVCCALVSAASAQERTVVKGRVPFQVTLSKFIETGDSEVTDDFVVPAGRRLEILNVAAQLRMSSDYSGQFEVECVLRNPFQQFAIAILPLVMKLRFEPRPGSDFAVNEFGWAVAQPTLLHASAGQRVICLMRRYPYDAFGFVVWTLSGFTDDPL